MAALKLLFCLAFVAVVSAKGKYRCNGIDNGCCTKAKPCYEGDGDCDSDAECGKGLVCHNGMNNCAWGGNGDDCCARKGLRCKGIDNGCCTKKNPCIEGDGDCDNDAECLPGLTCHNGLNNCPWGGKGDDCCVRKGMRCYGIDNGCCTKAKPCVEGDGDCDSDAECLPGLKCHNGLNNCPWGGNGDDCCVKPKLRCKGIDNGCCTKKNPCGLDDGDCDNNAECLPGLICHNGLNNCAWGGNGDDCCTRPKKGDEPEEEEEEAILDEAMLDEAMLEEDEVPAEDH